MIPQIKLPVMGLAPAADAAGRTGDWINVKNAIGITVVCLVTQGNAAVVNFSVKQATSAAGAGVKAVDAAPIWNNFDTDASNVLTRQATDADNLSTDAALKNKMVVFHIDPAKLDMTNGFKYVAGVTAASNVANITSILYIVHQANQNEPAIDILT